MSRWDTFSMMIIPSEFLIITYDFNWIPHSLTSGPQLSHATVWFRTHLICRNLEHASNCVVRCRKWEKWQDWRAHYRNWQNTEFFLLSEFQSFVGARHLATAEFRSDEIFIAISTRVHIHHIINNNISTSTAIFFFRNIHLSSTTDTVVGSQNEKQKSTISIRTISISSLPCASTLRIAGFFLSVPFLEFDSEPRKRKIKRKINSACFHHETNNRPKFDCRESAITDYGHRLPRAPQTDMPFDR